MHFFKRHMWSVILLGVVMSFALPIVGILASPFLHIFFMTMMFLSTLNINLKNIRRDLKHPSKTIFVLLLIHFISPLIVYLSRSLFSPELYVGLILATSVPSGISAIFITHMFKGDTTQALITTSLSSLSSPILVPLSLMIFAGSEIQLDGYGMFSTSVKLIIIPLLLAQVVARTSWKKTLSQRSDGLNVILLFLIIIAMLSPVRSYLTDSLLLTLALSSYVAVLIVMNFLIGFSIGKTFPERIANAINAGFKNFALAMVLALTYFNGVVAMPAIVYALVTSILLIPLEWFVEGFRKPLA